MLDDDQIQAMLATRAARAQGVAPERILERAMHAGPATRREPWRPALRALGGLAVAAVIIGLVVLAGNLGAGPTGPGGVGGPGSPSPTAAVGAATPTPTEVAITGTAAPTATATPATTPSPTPSPTPGCDQTQLAARILDWTGAAGSRIADVRLTSAASAACKVPTKPGLEFLDAKGVILASAAAGAGSLVVDAGATLTTQVEVQNYCGSDPSLPVTVAFELPNGGGRVVAAPLKDGSEDFAVPPCNGTGPAVVAMNGWKR